MGHNIASSRAVALAAVAGLPDPCQPASQPASQNQARHGIQGTRSGRMHVEGLPRLTSYHASEVGLPDPRVAPVLALEDGCWQSSSGLLSSNVNQRAVDHKDVG